MGEEPDWDAERLHFAAGEVGLPGPLAGEFVRLAASLMSATTLDGVLRQVVDATLAAVPGAELVSVTLQTPDGALTTPAHTHELAARLDELQYTLREGPSLEATRTPGLAVAFSKELGSGAEFPRFGPVAAELGVHSVLAVGMFPRGEPRLGSLNIYSREVGGLDELDRDVALILSAHVATALAASLAASDADAEAAQLRQALLSRDVIGQAKGILMERRGITADEAFDVLRRASQSLNVKLAQVAQTLVDRRAEI